MKLKIFYLFLVISNPLLADSSTTLSDRLTVIPKTFDGKTGSWLKHYDPSINKAIPITIKFKVPKVKSILLTDLNASNKTCTGKPVENMLYLSFDPDKNLQQITTRINKPCLIDRQAKLKVTILTKYGNRLYSVTHIPIDPLSTADQY